MTAEVEASPVPAGDVAMDADGRLAAELPCVRCGYVLRGLRTEDACPECGAAVAASLRDDALAAADPRWRGRLRRGLLVLVIATGVAALASIVMPLANILLVWILTPTFIPPVAVAWSLIAMGVALTRVAGVWLVTTAEPRRTPVHREDLRRASRWLIVASVILATSAIIGGMARGGIGFIALGDLVFLLVHTGRVIAGAAETLALVLLMCYVARQAHRLPGAEMPRTTRWGVRTGWAELVLGLLAGAVQIVLFYLWSGGGGGTTSMWNQGMMAAFIVSSVGTLAGLVFAVCQIVLYRRVRRNIPA